MTTKHGYKQLLIVGVLSALAACAPDPEELLARATSSLEKGDLRSATIDLKSLLQKDPNHARARALLGTAYVLAGDVTAAEIELDKAKELGAPSELVFVPSCRVLVGQGKFDEVLAECEPTSAASPSERAELQIIRGNALNGLMRPEEAEQLFEAALETEPNNLGALLGLATASAADGGIEAARSVLRGATDEVKRSARYWLAVAGLEMGSGEFAEAEKSYQSALELASGPPDSVERLMGLGGLAEAQVRQGDLKAADATSAQLLRVAPNLPLAKQLRAQVAAAGGHTAEARQLLDEVIASQPQNLQARVLLAIVNMQEGNLDQAQMHLQQVVANQPNNVRAQRLLAELRAKLDSPAESLAGLKGALDDTRDAPEMLAMAGRLSLAAGNREQALSYLAAASKTAGESGERTQIDIANGYLMAGELDRALEVLENMPAEGAAARQRDALMLLTLARKGDQVKLLEEAKAVVERSPEDAAVRSLVGGVYASVGQMDLARQQFREAAKLAPKSPSPYLYLARVDLAENKPQAAEANFKQALAKEPKNLMANLGLAMAASARKDTKAAETYLLQAVKDHPASADARLALGQFYLAAGDVSSARAAAEAATKENPTSGAMANVRGLILVGAQDVPKAIASFEEAVRLEPKSTQYAVNLARAKLTTRDVSGAISVVNKALQGAPKSPPLLAIGAAISLQGGEVEQAAGYVERLRQAAPDAPTTLALEGDLAVAQRRYKDALGHYRKAIAGGANTQLVLSEYNAARLNGEPNPEAGLEKWLDQNPGDVGVASVLAEQRRAKGDLDGAISVYEAALAKSPDNVVLLNNLAVLYDLKQNGAKAISYAERAYRAAPKTPAIADTYGWMLFKQGKTSEAKPLIDQAAKGLPDNAEVQYHQAAVLAKEGNKDEATRLLKKAVAGQLPADQKAEVQKLLQQLSN